jgi:hypothetical protein
MKGKEKKELILKKIEDGDPRSYNEISADLELELWTLRYKSEEQFKQLISMKRK